MKAQYLDISESGKTVGLEIMPKTVMNKALKANNNSASVLSQSILNPYILNVICYHIPYF
jgi:hypothetical protein